MGSHSQLLVWLRSGLIVPCLVIQFWATVAAEATEKLTSHPALDVFASPSADGRFLAFVSERSGNPDIWMKPLSAGVFSPPRQITTQPGKDTAPALNKNGSKLLYVSYKMDPRGDIYLLDVLSGEETRLTDSTSGDTWPSWGPNGDTVYYLKRPVGARKQAIVRLSLQGRKEELIVDDASSFSVGPSGWIVYSDGRRLVAVAESAPTSPKTLTTGESLDLCAG